ncbi:MFS transporter [Streptomyces sp. NPDC020490]|uniref:MFS transporter n=1 Tax=Streptomyces sp. NPDC020490 TaxID=3365078 RepID=UPI003798A104
MPDDLDTEADSGAAAPAEQAALAEQAEQAEQAVVPLSRNRDFTLLWISQLASVLGSRMAYVAYPLLVLSLTGSPVMAGLIGTVRAAPQWILGLPAGLIADRVDRKRLMLTCDLVCLIALTTLVVGLATDLLTYPQVVVVALVEGSAAVLFSPAEVAALRHVVPASQVRAATARNESREYGAMLAGPSLGGALFAVSRFLPFLGDALSYLVSFLTVSAIRTPFRSTPARGKETGGIIRGIGVGLSWLVRQRFLRASVLMVAASNMVGNAMPTLLIVTAHAHGSSPALVGAVLTLSGAGGLIGSVVASWAADRVSATTVVLGFPWVWAALLPLLFLPGGVVVMGVVFGLMLAVAPLWNSVISTYRIVLVPDQLQGRVDSACRFFTQSVSLLSPLMAGVLLEYAGTTTTIVSMLAWMVLLGVVGLVMPVLRNPPPLPGEDAATA